MERQDEAAMGAPLLEGLLQRISELMGDGASLAAFRFAAFEEGRRIAGGYRGDDLRTLLERLDAVLGHRTRLLEEAPTSVRLRVEGSPMLSSDRPIVQGIALGVLEGALLVNRGRRYTGRITGAAGPPGAAEAVGAVGAAGPGAGPTGPEGPPGPGRAGARAKGSMAGAEPGAVLVELEEAVG